MFSDGTIYAYIGYAAGLATVSAFAIQTVRILRTKNITGLSSYMYTMYSLSLICWFAYGVYLDSWIMAIANLITFLFTFLILLLILYYDEEDKIERYRRDPLTYVFNKRYYEESVSQKIIESTIHKQPFSIVVGKINNLETIHEQMGGKYRNRALKYTAKTLEKALRDSDFIARIDDNLFAIYLANTDEKIAKKVSERVLESVNNIEIKNGSQSFNIQMLLGICSSAEKDDLNGLTQKAIKAISEIPSKGRIRVKTYKKEEKKKTTKK
ncbi:MAG: diguanylate cyclase [Alphaproteobacteria bacterium]|nr:diguanylate cyclase [Alphaproteobacteria bacterium]